MQIPSKGRFKSGKPTVLQARNRSFVRRGFRRKVPFFLSRTKLSEVVQDIAFDALAQDCSIQVLYFFFFLKSCLQSLCVCNCFGNRVFNPSHIIPLSTHPTVCLKCVFRPSFTNSPRLWATFCHLRRFSGTCCLEAPFQALQLCNHQHSKLFWLVA